MDAAFKCEADSGSLATEIHWVKVKQPQEFQPERDGGNPDSFQAIPGFQNKAADTNVHEQRP